MKEIKIIDFVKHPIYIFRLLKVKLGFSRCSKCGAKLGIKSFIERDVYGSEIRICYLCNENKSLKKQNDLLKKELELKEEELQELNHLNTLLNKVKSGEISFFELNKDYKKF